MIFFICQKIFNLTKKDIISYRNKLQVPIVNKIKTGELKSNARRTAEEKKVLLKKKNIYCNQNWLFVYMNHQFLI